MRIVLIGSAGYWGQKLSRVIQRSDHELVAEINLPEDGAERVRPVAENERADAAVVATPPETHFPIVMAALEAGLDVLCEKPLALNGSDAAKLHAAAIDRGRVLSVDSTFVHTDAFGALLERRFKDELLSYQSLRLARGPGHVTVPAGWDLVVHDIAVLTALGVLNGVGSGHHSPGGDVAQAVVPLRSGSAHIQASRSWHGKTRSIVLTYSSGTLLWDSESLWRCDGEDTHLILRESGEVLPKVLRDFDLRRRRRAVTGITDGAHGAAVCAHLEALFGRPRGVSKAHRAAA